MKEKLIVKGKMKSDLKSMFSRLAPKSKLPESVQSPKKSNALGLALDDGQFRNAADGNGSIYCQAQTSGDELSPQDINLTGNKDERSGTNSEANTIDKIGHTVCDSPKFGQNQTENQHQKIVKPNLDLIPNVSFHSSVNLMGDKCSQNDSKK